VPEPNHLEYLRLPLAGKNLFRVIVDDVAAWSEVSSGRHFSPMPLRSTAYWWVRSTLRRSAVTISKRSAPTCAQGPRDHTSVPGQPYALALERVA
jgi:hypothetical protein